MENVEQRAIDLTHRILRATSDLDFEVTCQWKAVVAVSLSQANERLHSVSLLLDNNYFDSAIILSRSLFELAGNLAYIDKDTDMRLPEYLKHGGVPTTIEDVEQLRLEIQNNPSPSVKDIIPGRAWKQMKEICCDLGPPWLDEYFTFYRRTSVPTHAGSFTLGHSYKQLLEQPTPSVQDKAEVLVTTSVNHLRVAAITSNTFPQSINPTEVSLLKVECGDLCAALLDQVS